MDVRVYHGTVGLINPKRPVNQDIIYGSVVATSMDKLLDKLVFLASGQIALLSTLANYEFNRLVELGHNREALDVFCKFAREAGFIATWTVLADTLQYDK